MFTNGKRFSFVVVIFAIVAVFVSSSKFESLIEERLNSEENINRATQSSSCQDQLSVFTCQEVVEQNRCIEDNVIAQNCQKSCGFCLENYQSDNEISEKGGEFRGAQCADKVPACSQFGGVAQKQLCCSFIDFMNQTCAKSCNFCTETSIIPVSPIQGFPMPGLPGGTGGSGGAPTIVTQQNPCNVDTSKPPTVGVNPSG